jgi:putative acetyltransferase
MDIIENYPSDTAEILSLHKTCFPTDAEAKLVARLSQAGDIAISVAAQQEGKVIAHVLFSVMRAPFRAIGLAPISVADKFRRQGIAEKIINTGLELAAKEDWQAVFVLGDPSYYSRFGFSAHLAASFTCPYQGPYLMALSLSGNSLPQITGNIEYAPAFAEM